MKFSDEQILLARCPTKIDLYLKQTDSLYLFLQEERLVLLKMESRKHTAVSYQGVFSGFGTCAYCGILARSIVWF